jgi:nucleotide-binding universal stress UspA family protein
MGLRHVLVATDFSEPAARATSLAITLAEKFGAKLTLLHAYTLPTYGYADGLYWPVEDLARAAREVLDAELEKVKRRLPGAEGVVRMGLPWEQIILLAKEQNADLIVMGTHGRRGLARIALGSVAERVVRLAPVPVMTVGAGAKE